MPYTDEELKKSMADFAIKAGTDPALVERMFGLNGAAITPGMRAQAAIDARIADKDFVARWNAGDADAIATMHLLHIGVAWQQKEDRAEQLRISTEAVAKADAEQAAAAKAEADKAAAAAADIYAHLETSLG